MALARAAAIVCSCVGSGGGIGEGVAEAACLVTNWVGRYAMTVRRKTWWIHQCGERVARGMESSVAGRAAWGRGDWGKGEGQGRGIRAVSSWCYLVHGGDAASLLFQFPHTHTHVREVLKPQGQRGRGQRGRPQGDKR